MRFDELSWAVKKAICSLFRVRRRAASRAEKFRMWKISHEKFVDDEDSSSRAWTTNFYIYYIYLKWMDGWGLNEYRAVVQQRMSESAQRRRTKKKPRREKRREEKVYWKDLRWKIIISTHPTTMILMKRKFRCDIIWLMILHDLFRVIQSKRGKRGRCEWVDKSMMKKQRDTSISRNLSFVSDKIECVIDPAGSASFACHDVNDDGSLLLMRVQTKGATFNSFSAKLQRRVKISSSSFPRRMDGWGGKKMGKTNFVLLQCVKFKRWLLCGELWVTMASNSMQTMF